MWLLCFHPCCSRDQNWAQLLSQQAAVSHRTYRDSHLTAIEQNLQLFHPSSLLGFISISRMWWVCLTNLIIKFYHQNPTLQNHLQPATKCQPAAFLVLRWPRPLLVPKGYRGKISPLHPYQRDQWALVRAEQIRQRQNAPLGPQRRVTTVLNLPSYWPLQSCRKCCWAGRGARKCVRWDGQPKRKVPSE